VVVAKTGAIIRLPNLPETRAGSSANAWPPLTINDIFLDDDGRFACAIASFDGLLGMGWNDGLSKLAEAFGGSAGFLAFLHSSWCALCLLCKVIAGLVNNGFKGTAISGLPHQLSPGNGSQQQLLSSVWVFFFKKVK
jgi:hypothetical protein